VQAALLSRALLLQDRPAEAEALALAARSKQGHEVLSDVIADCVSAVLASLDGRSAESVELAERAVLGARGIEAPSVQADALVALATCLTTDRADEAPPALAEARGLYEAKGNLAALRRLEGR
jgi:hypothetical protein